MVLAGLGLTTPGCQTSSGSLLVGLDARVQVDPQAVQFGDVPEGQKAQLNVTVRHVGTEGVVVLSPIRLQTDSPDLSLGIVERTELQPGGEARIQIVYASDNDAPDAGELVIGTNIPGTEELVIPVTTPGQRAQLSASPSDVNFGVVQEGVEARLTVQIANTGTVPTEITGFEILADEDSDFDVDLPEGFVIGTNEARPLDLLYRPTGIDNDSATIVLTTAREDVSLTIGAVGEEETPILVVEPSTIQLGWVEPGGNRLINAKVRNEGNKSLIVESMALDTSIQGIAVAGELVTQLPLTLQPGEVETFAVLFQPQAELPMTSDPIATLTVRSTDVARDPYEVPIFGAAGVPRIEVIPSDTVDFAYVAEGFESERTVTVVNVSGEPVAVTDAELQDPTSPEFKFQSKSLLPATLQPGDSVELRLTFDNTGGEDGTEFARFVLSTTDPLVPQYPLDVVARRSERPTCEPAFVPELLAMGAQKAGEQAIDQIKVVNYGSGNCIYQDYEMLGCTKLQYDVRHIFDCDPQKPWTPFSVESAPGFGTILGPGESLTFGIAFDAPPVQNEVVGRDSYYARIALFMHDPNLPGFRLVAPPGGWMAGVNLRAESAEPMVSVFPQELDFGLVRTDCESFTKVVSISNIGPLEAEVSDLTFTGCDGQVTVDGSPPTPFTIPAFQSRFLNLRFAPSLLGDTDCTLDVATDSLNQPVTVLPLTGTGVDTTHQVDSFEQLPPPKVDVLFVVDDSGSMADEQLLLKKELPNLVDIAVGWGQDYHLAATTTDTELIQGKFKGWPPYATSSDDPAEFADNLQVGIAGFWQEAGLQAAWMALSGTNQVSTDIECVDAPNQCPAGLLCKSGYCRGPNWGFLREDAELVIILISDEEDSSDQSVSDYVAQFAGLKPPQSSVGVKVHAIVTPPTGCAGANFGSPGLRYIQTVEQFDGYWTSICATDFGAEFENVAQKTFGLREQFYPTLPPDPATLEVRVDGEPCTTGWKWNAQTQSVVFDPEGACFPAFGEAVEIEYDVFCAEPASGPGE